MIVISNDKIVLLEYDQCSINIHNSLYIYDIKENKLDKLRDIPLNTKIISVLAGTQLLIHRSSYFYSQLILVDTLCPSILKEISSTDDDYDIYKYNFTKIKTLSNSKIICGSSDGSVAIVK